MQTVSLGRHLTGRTLRTLPTCPVGVAVTGGLVGSQRWPVSPANATSALSSNRPTL